MYILSLYLKWWNKGDEIITISNMLSLWFAFIEFTVGSFSQHIENDDSCIIGPNWCFNIITDSENQVGYHDNWDTSKCSMIEIHTCSLIYIHTHTSKVIFLTYVGVKFEWMILKCHHTLQAYIGVTCEGLKFLLFVVWAVDKDLSPMLA